MNLEKEIEEILVLKPIYVKKGLSKEKKRIAEILHKSYELKALFNKYLESIVPEEGIIPLMYNPFSKESNLYSQEYEMGYKRCISDIKANIKKLKEGKYGKSNK